MCGQSVLKLIKLLKCNSHICKSQYSCRKQDLLNVKFMQQEDKSQAIRQFSNPDGQNSSAV